jgi:transposase, IS30 family
MRRRRFGGWGNGMPGEVKLDIYRRLMRGETWRGIAGEVGVSQKTIGRLLAEAGGMPPRWKDRCPRQLSLVEREEIATGVSAGQSLRTIAAVLGRHPSTVSREVKANGGRQAYRAWRAERRAFELARRPKQTLLVSRPRLAAYVTEKLQLRWSPPQISARLKLDHPDDLEMRVSPETIYQTLFVQGRGGLRKELTACLRSGRTMRRAHRRPGSVNPGKLVNMVMISERPAEVEDRAVPGHWEGDLIIGRNGESAVGTLVERSSRYLMLIALPDGRSAPAVRDALARQVQTLPQQLRKSITWDQGKEMAEHLQLSVASGVDVYFCDPYHPWQRGTNENTNGLVRQYLPKGVDLSGYTQTQLDAIANELNGRPRQTLNWLTPSEKLSQFVASTT